VLRSAIKAVKQRGVGQNPASPNGYGKRISMRHSRKGGGWEGGCFHFKEKGFTKISKGGHVVRQGDE